MYIQAHGSKQSDVGPYYCMVWKAGYVKDNPEFRIMRLASKCWIKEIIIASLISFQIILTQLIILTLNYPFL